MNELKTNDHVREILTISKKKHNYIWMMYPVWYDEINDAYKNTLPLLAKKNTHTILFVIVNVYISAVGWKEI